MNIGVVLFLQNMNDFMIKSIKTHFHLIILYAFKIVKFPRKVRLIESRQNEIYTRSYYVSGEMRIILSGNKMSQNRR